MSKSNDEACDFCGDRAISNVRVTGEPVTRYLDGPPRATFPRLVLCYDCAEEVSSYLDARTGALEDGSGERGPFSVAEAESLLETVEANRELVIEFPGDGYGLRYHDGRWESAVTPLPAPPTVRHLEREEVIDRITSAPKVTLKRLDRDAWQQYVA